MEIITELLNRIVKPYLQLALEHYLDNPWMKIVLAFIPAILGISYPLIAQTISRLDEKYKSTHIVEQFKKEPYHNYFILNLKISVVLTLLCFIFSVKIFLAAFLSLCTLLYLFFKYLSRLLEYQSPLILFQSLNRNLNLDFSLKEKKSELLIKKRKKEILKLWHPIIDLYKYSIVNNDKKLEGEIRFNFIYPIFDFIKNIEQREVELIKFPSEFYNSTYDIIATYLNNYNTDYYSNVEVFVGELYFPDSSEENVKQFYHEDTLVQIWRNLTLLIEHDRGDKIVRYWGNASQHFDFYLRLPSSEYDENYVETEDSVAKRNKIEKNRKLFLQFHTVLGAYLMHKTSFNTLNKTWCFTQSQPPRYSLMPNSMGEIFAYYFSFLENILQSSGIVIRYWFKGVDFDSMNNSLDVKFAVRKYACILFLRQWIVKSYYGQNLLSFPAIPSSQAERKYWSENIVYFKRIVAEILSDVDLLKELNLKTITNEKCEQRGVDHPLTYLDKLKGEIDEEIDNELSVGELDKESIKNLDITTVKILTETYSSFRRIAGNEVTKANRDNISNFMEVIRGTRMLLDREAFIKNPGSSFFNYDGVTAQEINYRYYEHISSKFQLNSKLRYKVANGQLFDAIDRLGLISDKHVIVAFKVNFKYFRDYHNVEIIESEGSADFQYKAIPIFNFERGIPSVFNTLFVLEKEDLPMIRNRDWSEIEGMPEKTKERWKSMELIDADLKLYRKIHDLNSEEELRKEYIGNGKSEEELKNKVEIDIDFLGYCWFRKDIKMIELKESDKFQEGGIKNQLTDIEPF